MKRVKLYGHLGKKFGREFLFDVRTSRDAVRLLACNFKDFTQYLLQHNSPGYVVYVGYESVSDKELDYPSADREVIRIVPVVQGAGGNGGMGQIILGAALIMAAGPVAGLIMGTAFGGAMAVAGVMAGTALASFGSALVLGGISQLLFAPPQKESSANLERPENKPSYSFDGPVNTTRQGNPVPIGYGRLLIGSQVISAGLFAENIA